MQVPFELSLYMGTIVIALLYTDKPSFISRDVPRHTLPFSHSHKNGRTSLLLCLSVGPDNISGMMMHRDSPNGLQ